MIDTNTKHFTEMLKERNIPLEKVESTIAVPDRTEEMEDGTKHFLKQFENEEGRWVRVVVNMKSDPTKESPHF